MKTVRCDILVVGAGPAGASAARAAAEKNARVIVVEKKDEIGRPVRCAEYIPAQLPGVIGPARDYVVQTIKGMRTFLPDGAVSTLNAPGYTIDRHLFDQTLAFGAKAEGADIRVATSVVSLEKDGAVVKTDKETYKISADIIIGADGPHSFVGKSMGSRNTCLIPAVQVRVRLRNPLNYTEVYFDSHIFGGYGWLFPKGQFANVGLAAKVFAGRRMLNELLERFILRLDEAKKIYPGVLQQFGGWIPAGPARKIVKGNILLVGDAAGQTHPITGAGIFPAVIGGEMAGIWAARASSKKDPGLLTGYEKEWEEMFGEAHDRASLKRAVLEKEWHRLDAVIRSCWVAFGEYYK